MKIKITDDKILYFLTKELKEFFCQNNSDIEFEISELSERISASQNETHSKFGFCLGLNFERNSLSYIPISRMNRFNINENDDLQNLTSQQINMLLDADLRRKFAVQTSVRRCLAATGIDIPEFFIDELEYIFNSQDIVIKLIDNEISSVYEESISYTGSLGQSCMQAKNKKHFFEIYDQEPSIQCLVARDKNNNLIGRAIIWTTVDGYICCDRRYGVSRYVEIAIKKYALEHGMYAKSNNNYNNVLEWLKPINSEQAIPIEQFVKLSRLYDYYPYMDTFYVLNESSDNILLGCEISANFDGDRLRSTGGDIVARPRCCNCDVFVNENSYHDDDYYCEDCFDEYYVHCFNCDQIYRRDSDSLTTVSNDDVVCQSCLDDNYLCCDECDEYFYYRNIYQFTNCNICCDCVNDHKPN